MKNNLKRKIYIICVASAMFFGIFTNSVSANNGLESKRLDIYAENDLVKAYELIEQSFDVDENGNILYPDEYGGAYIDKGYLYIYLTELSETNIRRYYLLSGESHNLKFLEAKHSMKYLNSLYDNISAIAGDYNISFFAVDVKENKFLIGVAPPKNDIARKQNKESLGFSTSKTIDVLSNLLDDEVYIFEEANYAEMCSIIGGEGIITVEEGNPVSVGGEGSTVCVCGTYNNEPALLIAGHAVRESKNNNSDRWTDVYYNGTYIGEVVKAQYSNGGLGDYAIVKLFDKYANLISNKIKKTSTTTLSVVGTGSSVVGNTVYCYGNTTRQQSKLYVMNINVSFNMVDDSVGSFIVTGLVRARIDSGDVKKGDSGGPVYRLSSATTATLVGDISARCPSEGSYYEYMIYSPVYYAENCDYPNGGFVVKTS